MFLGEVLDTLTVQVPAHGHGRSTPVYPYRIFRILVDESFAGDQGRGEVVKVRTGIGDGDCGYEFAVGKRYLVDAYLQKAAADDQPELLSAPMRTSICSFTMPESDAAAILSELRTTLARGRQPDLDGTVTLIGRGWQDRRPLPGVSVTIVSAGDHARFHATVDASGRYAFNTLPAGTYSAAFDLPAHTVLLYSYDNQTSVVVTDDKQPSVVIPLNDGTGMACHLSVVAGPAGGIRGLVFDAGGHPFEGRVFAYPKAEYRPKVIASFSGDAHRGAFSLEHLPDGEYDLVFNINPSKVHTITRVSVHDGEVTRGVEVRLK